MSKMDITINPILYQPNKSSVHGHFVRTKNWILATQKIDDFVRSQADGSFDNNKSIELYSHTELGEDFRIKTSELFGTPFIKDDTGYMIKWQIPNENLLDAVGYIQKEAKGILRLVYAYHFDWKQQGLTKSSFIVQIFDNKFLVSTTIHLPSFNDKREFHLFLAQMNSSLPFKLKARNFKCLVGKKWRKMDESLTCEIEKSLNNVG